MSSEIDGYVEDEDSIQDCMVKALNEYDLTNNWRKKFKDNQKVLKLNQGVVVSSEVKNQTCKISKWIV